MNFNNWKTHYPTLLITFSILYLMKVNAATDDPITPPSEYTVDRGPDGDIIYYNHTIGCKAINATYFGTNKCQCEDEITFYWRNVTGKPRDLKCWYRPDRAHRLTTIGAVRGVTSVEFEDNKWSFSATGDGEIDFTQPNVTINLGTYCKSLEVSGDLSIMGYNGWVDANYDADFLFSVSKQYMNASGSWEYILEIDSNDKDEYSGHLVQIPLLCQKTYSTRKSETLSLLLKFSGQRTYTDPMIPPTVDPTIITSTYQSTTQSSTVMKKKKSGDDSDDTTLIIGVSIASVVIVILFVVIIVMCCKRRHQQTEQPNIKMNGNGNYQPPSYTYPNAKNVTAQQTNPFSRASNAFLDISQTPPSQHAPPVPKSPRPSFKPSSNVQMTDQNGGQQYMPIINTFNNTNEYGKSNDQPKQDEYLDLSGPQYTKQTNDTFGKPNQRDQPEMYVDLNGNAAQNVYEGLGNIRNSYADPYPSLDSYDNPNPNEPQVGYVDLNQSQGEYVDPNQSQNNYTDLNQSQSEYTDPDSARAQNAYADLNQSQGTGYMDLNQPQQNTNWNVGIDKR